MPNWLKKDPIRLFEASIETLSLGIQGLGIPKRFELCEEAAAYSASIGLAGVSAELAMSAVLVQALGADALKFDSGLYKTGGAILDDFRRIIRNPVPRTAFIIKGVANPRQHLNNLYEKTIKFKMLITLRAAGLHAGQGPSYDVCVVAINDVISLLNTLAVSLRIKPYLSYLPLPIHTAKERTIIAEEIVNIFRNSESDSERARCLSSLYLVLPETPEESPDWIEALERVSIAPKEGDISFLLNVLEQSGYATMIRVSSSGDTLPVTVESNNPSAIPISAQYLKREFTQLREQWYADIGNANGRLNKGSLDTPPADFVFDLFGIKLSDIGIAVNADGISAHETWSFIVSSLSFNGTPGPYWFLIRKTKDLGQLKALIEKASKLGNGYLKRHVEEVLIGLQAIKNNRPLSAKVKFIKLLLEEFDESEHKKDNLSTLVQKNVNTFRALSEDVGRQVALITQGTISVGTILNRIVSNEIELGEAKIYWVRTFCEACHEEADIPALLSVLKFQELNAAFTAARKAIRLIDFLSFGPEIIYSEEDVV